MSNVRFELNHAGIAELLKSEGFRVHMEARMDRVSEAAKEHAPVETGEYRDSITPGVAWDGDRWTGYVKSDVTYACAVEVKHRTLGTALEAGSG